MVTAVWVLGIAVAWLTLALVSSRLQIAGLLASVNAKHGQILKLENELEWKKSMGEYSEAPANEVIDKVWGDTDQPIRKAA
jgi:hypothetical protein